MDNVMLDDEWRENFRLSKVNFFKLCEELRAYLRKKTTNMRKPVSVEKQIAVTLALYQCLCAYPLLPQVMKEFPGGRNTVKEQFFGYCPSSARMVIECAFGRLKGRFGALRRDMDINIDDLPHVIYACFLFYIIFVKSIKNHWHKNM